MHFGDPFFSFTQPCILLLIFDPFFLVLPLITEKLIKIGTKKIQDGMPHRYFDVNPGKTIALVINYI